MRTQRAEEMGKCMRRAAKVTGDVAVTKVSSESSIGVRTRAKTLAIQRQQSAAPPPSNRDSCYLQLRSRRLEKPHQQQNSRKVRHRNDGDCLSNDPISCSIEASLGENYLDCEARDRNTRESTPCNLIRAADIISTPGSTTKQTRSSANQRSQGALLINVPTPPELEEVFTREEQSQQLLFIEKYNFDVVNDLPLSGRYEWVRVRP
ncbi:hypothetical protein BUALT_Bualt02G0193100 [Buddleja alternifolia]|uniref:Cyclin-dependent kinase inhibitor n=1 Tax=Buddleja alternifolia TaxID=168488 RepID=A0AAV6Y5R4_9LAMI|nr:hypothetical protein BUALT_Bualt02G0193100 [Buddleja alternifolia]